MKLFLLCLVLVMGLCFAWAEHYKFGTKGPNDKLLEKRNVWRSVGLLTNRWEYPRFPSEGFYKGQITFINVTDNINNGGERYAKIMEGGVGQKHVKFECRSGTFRSFDYDFEIYGKEE